MLQNENRSDYDIALLRIDYPIIDQESGMNILYTKETEEYKFDPETILPICLPPSIHFKDTNRLAVSVGMGITGER